MQKELLIIKSGEDYVRVKTENYSLCQLDKASVFPIDNLAEVKKHVKKLKEKDFPLIAIYKSAITSRAGGVRIILEGAGPRCW